MSGITSNENWRWHRREKANGYFNVDFSVTTKSVVSDLNGAVLRAVKRADRRAVRWLVTHSVREIARELKIKQAPIRKRFQVHRDGELVKIWVGLLEVGAHYLGNVSQNVAGVKAGGQQYDSAFYRAVYGSERKVYIRAKKNQDLGYETVSDRRRYRKPHYDEKFMSKNGGRFPLQVVGVSIQDVGEDVLYRYERRLNSKYKEFLHQELEVGMNGFT